MKVSLVGISKPLADELKSSEDLMVYCARVSNPNNQLNLNTGPKLLKYCLDHGHFSIFEMVDMVVEIETSRAIAAQILRHRSFNFQEFSQRYAKVDDGAFEVYLARRQDLSNRQNSIDDLPNETKKWFIKAQKDIQKKAMNYYNTALEAKVAKEQARFLLPLNTKTRLYMKGSVRSWLHYLDLRCGNGTQLEHKEIADAIKGIFCEQFPIIAKAKGWSI